MESKQYYLAKWLRWAGRVIGLVAAVFYLVMLVTPAIFDLLAGDGEAVSILLAVLVGVALAGAILSWWREWPGGILLVLASIGLGILIAVYAGRDHVLAWFRLGLPYLVAAILLFTSRRLAR